MAADPLRQLAKYFDLDMPTAQRAIEAMPARSWLALQVAMLAADDGVARKKLCNRLLKVADKSRVRDPCWPSNLRRRACCCCGRLASQDYLPDLVELVVKEFENPAEFEHPRLRVRWFGVSERRWLKLMLRPYELLQGTLDDWYRSGLTQLQKHADCTDS
ncbi:MAG: hypothetical protein IIA11_05750 [Proteobacteria bacterium]|nr:hypothetical protein [Pseudomonadota bacterium]